MPLLDTVYKKSREFLDWTDKYVNSPPRMLHCSLCAFVLSAFLLHFALGQTLWAPYCQLFLSCLCLCKITHNLLFEGISNNGHHFHSLGHSPLLSLTWMGYCRGLNSTLNSSSERVRGECWHYFLLLLVLLLLLLLLSSFLWLFIFLYSFVIFRKYCGSKKSIFDFWKVSRLFLNFWMINPVVQYCFSIRQ